MPAGTGYGRGKKQNKGTKTEKRKLADQLDKSAINSRKVANADADRPFDAITRVLRGKKKQKALDIQASKKEIASDTNKRRERNRSKKGK